MSENRDTAMRELTEVLGKLDKEKLELLLPFAQYLSSQSKINHDNKNLMELIPKLLKLQNAKETQYGRSWCKHDDMSAFFNLERKWDRIYNIMTRAMENGVKQTLEREASTPTETFIDTLVDLGLYSLMWTGLSKELRPEQYEKFISNNHLGN